MARPPDAAFERARLGLEARQIEQLDDAPDLTRRVIVLDQAVDIERL